MQERKYFTQKIFVYQNVPYYEVGSSLLQIGGIGYITMVKDLDLHGAPPCLMAIKDPRKYYNNDNEPVREHPIPIISYMSDENIKPFMTEKEIFMILGKNVGAEEIQRTR